MGNSISAAHSTVGMCSVEPYTAPIHFPAASQCSLTQAVPAPDGATCEFKGYLSRPDIVADWPVPVDDVTPQATCVQACWQLPTCGALSYDQDTRQCLLYGSPIQAQTPRKSRTGARFFEPECFYQTCEISEGVNRTETRSEIDSPFADFKLRHCGLEETTSLTDPEKDYDHRSYFPVDLPFPVQLYGASSDSLYMSINGHISFTSPFMTCPEPHVLPHYTSMTPGNSTNAMPSIDGGLPESSLCALWTPQSIVTMNRALHGHGSAHRSLFSQQQVSFGARQKRALKRDLQPELEFEDGLAEQGMRYRVSGEVGTRKVTFTWKTSKSGDVDVVYDYDVVYREDVPGVWMVRYRSVGDAGMSAVVGLQGTLASTRFLQYASLETPLADDMTLVLQSSSNTIRRVRRTINSKVYAAQDQ